MKISIKTTAENCHLFVYIKSGGHTLLTLAGTDEAAVELLPGHTYFFEWAMWAEDKAHIRVEAAVLPPNAGFQPLTIDKNYPSGAEDGNSFPFTL